MSNKYQYIYELWQEQSQHITSSPALWMEFLRTAAWSYKYRFEDQILIYAQRPDARACADFDTWNNKMNRWIKRNSKGIALLSNDGYSLRYVFDISDTRSPVDRPLRLWEIKQEDYEEMIEMIDNKYGPFDVTHDLGESIVQMADVIAEENCQDYVSSLIKYNQGSRLEHLEESEIRTAFVHLVSCTIAYEMIERVGLNTGLYFSEEDFHNITYFNTLDTTGQLGVTCHDLCEMGMQDISAKAREIMIRTFAKPSKTVQNMSIENERSNSHETDHIQSGRRLSNAKLDGERIDIQRTLRTIEIPVSQRESSGTSVLTESKQPIEPTLDGNRTGSTSEKGNIDGSTAVEESSTGQGNSADGVGAAYERTKSTGRRNRSDGTDVQLTLDLFLSEEEQIKLIEKARNMEHKPFAFSFAQEETDLFLRLGSNTDHARMLIATEFMKQKSTEEIIPTLKEIYHGGYGIQTEKRSISAWYGDEGIYFANGKTARDNIHAQLISWEDVTKRIEELLGEGKFATNVELIEAPLLERKMLSEKLWYLYHDLNDEIDRKSVFPSLSDIKDGGFPKETQTLAEQLKDSNFCVNLEKELQAFSEMYQTDRKVLRFHYHKINNIQKAISELNLPRREFDTEMFSLPEVKTFITDDEINQELIGGSSFSGGKKRIFDYFKKHQATKDRAEFLKNEYGTGGNSHALSGANGSGQNHDAKGIVYEKNNCEKVKLNWTQVANRIDKLIGKELYNAALDPQKQEEITPENDIIQEPVRAETVEDETADVTEESQEIHEADDSGISEKVEEVKLTEVLTNTDESAASDVALESAETKPQYQAGQKVFLDGTEFEITEVREHEVQLRDPSLYYPIFRVESMENFERLLSKDSRNAEQRKETTEIPAVNFTITDEHLGAGTPKERYKNNIAAIKMLFSLEKENRNATAEEQEILAKYVGWGGLADVFDGSKSNWSNEYSELKNLLSNEEYVNARESTLTAFYTPPIVIESIYQALKNLGFQYGNILEPACGTGNFMGLLPESFKDSKLYGIELDSITGRIAKHLYPNANIAVEGYEKTNLPDSFFDVAVGNVPFGQFSVSDKRYDKYHFNIHDYFFAKTIDKVRPGGIIAFLTSRFTMDKANSSVRKYISERAELLGAIRLPNNTFSESANTKAVSDIIFLQKRERPIILDEEWLTTEADEHGNVMNSYFISHPDMILGNIEKTKSMYGHEDLTVVPFEDRTLKQSLQTAIQSIQGHMDTVIIDENELESDDELVTIPADPTVRNYSYTVVDGEVYFRENSQMAKIELSKTAKNRVIGMIEIRDCIRKVIEYQKEDYPNSVIEQEQKKLNTLYDTFTKEYGLINSRGNSLAFRDDSAYYLLCSLENLNDDGTLKSKADIFTKRTIRKHEVKEAVDTSQEALMLSLSEKGQIDFEYMSSLTGFEKDKIIQDLHGVIFKIPNVTTPAEEKYVTADEYLSGNIREKLKIAELSADIDPQYQYHVEALKRVMPEELSASEIAVRIGATWIEPEVYQQFIFEILSTGYYAKRGIKVNFSKITGEWNVSNKNIDRGNAKAEKTFGTHRANAYRLIEDCLNLKATQIYDYEYDDEGKKVAVLNKKETMIAQQKQDAIKEAFKEWIWKDHDRREKLTKTYNELFNSTRPREYNGDHLVFPDMNSEITLRKHQKDAIARILYGYNALLSHVVGAGKTFEMVAACMELKRLGLSHKAMFIVPNHLIEQWGAEFLQLYPSANILVARKQDFEKSKRKKFCSRIATGDYDAIIFGHSMFEKIPVSIERQRKMIINQIENITQGIKELNDSNGARYSVKQLEKTKKSLKRRLEKLNSDDRKDDVIYFEELGVDRIFVDESHNYKNLFLYTKMRNVAGLSQTEAQKSSDLFMKCQYLDEITGGKGIVFATGTPISNSMTEMYTIQRYLQYNTLKEHGLEHFDCWASTFGETITAIELAPEGTGYRTKTRFAQFYNLPELINMFKEVADIKTADMLNLPVPTAHYETIAVKPSEIQKEIVASLAERAEKVRNGVVDPTQDNMLKITNDGRKLALDQRLLNPLLPDHGDSKVNACIKNVIRIYEDTSDKKSTQLIFCDMSTPPKSLNYLTEQLKEIGNEPLPYTSVYDDIATKLIRYGIPAEEIAYIHDAATDIKKKELFNKVRCGKVRILLGSTQKMGAGTNVQDLLIATHDLDCPWRPSDLEQRAGRIVRQGNTNTDVNIYRYVTEQTFDAYLYQLVENKQKFISQIMTSKSPVRTAEDIDEASLSYAEIKALASGNPLIKEKMDLDIQVGKLKLAKANYLSEKYDLEDKIIQYYPKKLALIREQIKGYEQDLNATSEVEEFDGMTLQGKFYEEKEIAGNVLLLTCKQHKTSDLQDIGQYRGFELKLSYDAFYNYHKLTLKKNAAYQVELGTDVYGNITRIDNAISSISKKLETERSLLSETEHQFETAKEEVQRPFAKEDELKEKMARLSEVNKELDIGKADGEIDMEVVVEEVGSKRMEMSR